MVTISFRIKKSQLKRIDRYARQKECSRSAYLREIIDAAAQAKISPDRKRVDGSIKKGA